MKQEPKIINSRADRGFVVVLALIALMSMSFFLITGAMTTTSSMKVSGNYAKTVDGFNIAEVGLSKARQILEVQDFNTLLTTYTQNSLPLISQTPFNDGSYEVRVADNDGAATEDANPYNDNDNIIVVTSIGRNAAGGVVQIEAHMQKPTATSPVEFPNSPGGGAGAAMLCGEESQITTQGTASISGYDYAVPTLPCTGTGCEGTNLGTGGYAIVAENNVTTSGSGFESPMGTTTQDNVSDTQCSEWKTLRDSAALLDDSHDDVVVLSGTGVSTQLNDCSDPKVFIINTDESEFDFTGNASLCGLLVIASNTSVNATGTSTLIGSILVMGPSADLNFVASSGTPRFFGQLIVESSAADDQKEVVVKGSAEINYSTEGIGYAEQALNDALGTSGGGGGGGLVTMAWKETY